MKKQRIAALLLALCLLTGCAAKEQPAGQTPEQPTEQTTEQPVKQEAAPTDSGNTSAVADASQMTTVQDVVEEGMTPVYADALNDGSYSIMVDCSSSMFKIEDCELTVEGGAMKARLTMGSDAYGWFYAGTAEDAAASDGSDYIPPENRSFELDVEALDAPVLCAAWSVKKELWYDRTLVFRSDSLPLTAFRSVATAESLSLTDGEYRVTVTLSGGSGKASVQSPAKLTVANGRAVAEIVWSSPNYDAMLVNETPCAPVNTEGNSMFLLDVPAFDHPIAVQAETTAMSQPHWIDYTLTFDSATLEPAS